MPILSTSSLTDMPLVRLRELIMSSRWVRPISEIKRWFIWLKWLEWNESAGLYTPRSLIRKPKIYTTVEGERNCKEAPCDGPPREAVTRMARYVFCQGFRDLNALTFRWRSLWPPRPRRGFTPAAPFSSFAQNNDSYE